jgi:hypothetical protein
MGLYPSLYQINTRVWLQELSSTLRHPATLADIPDKFLDQVAALGFDYVWFLDLWQTGQAGREVSLSHPEWLRELQATLPGFSEADVSGSPFAVTGLYPAPRFRPGDGPLQPARAPASQGLKLMVDFVPNHTALDHSWVAQHPEFYVQGSAADLEREPHNYRRAETGRGSLILAHGRNPYFPGWPDTFQLNYRHPGLKEAMSQVLLMLAEVADGVRCDMAMLVLPEVFQRTWGERSLPADGLAPVDEPFWPEATGKIKAKNASLSLCLRSIGTWSDSSCSRVLTIATIKSCMTVSWARTPGQGAATSGLIWLFQDKLARFLENHDELRAAHDFPVPAHQAAAIITYLTPGLRFFHEGQFEGRRTKGQCHVAGPFVDMKEKK